MFSRVWGLDGLPMMLIYESVPITVYPCISMYILLNAWFHPHLSKMSIQYAPSIAEKYR